MVIENKYLRKAIEKTKYIVLVKRYIIDMPGSSLVYVSPNASEIGMNVEMLNKGMKLSEDYIYPSDREMVMKTIHNAIDNRVQDYVHEYRMVGDDGVLRQVRVNICIEVVSEEENTYEVEFYIRDISAEKEKQAEIKRAIEEPNRRMQISPTGSLVISKLDNPGMIPQIQKMEMIMSGFSQLTNLYSVFVDENGKVESTPVGPATDLGDFYDLFETPTYKEFFKTMKEEVLAEMKPHIFDREEGGYGKLAMAPIFVGDNLQGFWVLGSYTPDETEHLEEIYELHWTTAELVSDFLLQSYNSIVESAKSRGAGKKLREELARQSIVNNALSKINSKLSEDVEQVIGETLREVALHMDLDRMFLYTFDKDNPKAFSLRSYFDVSGEMPSDDILTLLPERLYLVVDAIKRGNGCCMLDRTNMTQRDVINLMRYNFRAEIAYPIYLEGRLYGILIFAESKSERIWTKEELRFSQSISLLIQNMLENADGDDNVRNVNKHLIETYNSFHEGIFIRDLYTGYVFFSNKALNDMLGYDLTGGDSRKILKNLRDKFEHMDGVRKDIAGRKITNWCSYVPALDEIMDITEVPIEWLQGGAATMIIMKKAKDN